jgi:hypothetical protein
MRCQSVDGNSCEKETSEKKGVEQRQRGKDEEGITLIY